MNISDWNVLVVDDNIFKFIDIKRVLQNNGIINIKRADNQEEVWELLEQGEYVDLIVADMHYPLQKGADAKNNAGFILIKKMKETLSIKVYR